MVPFRKTGQLFQAISRGKPGKLVEKALTVLKNYQPNPEEELAHTSLLAAAYALTSMYSSELSDALTCVRFYDKLMAEKYPLKNEDWLKLAGVYRLIYEKTRSMESLEKAVHAGNLSGDPLIISETLIELYMRVRDDDTFHLCLEKMSRFLQLNPQDTDLLFLRANLYEEYGKRSKQPKFLQLAFEEYEKIVCIDPKNQKAKAQSIVALAFHALFTENADRISEAVYKGQLLSEHLPIELYAKGITLLTYAIYSSDLDEIQNAIYYFQRATSLDRTFALGWHYLGLSFFLMYEALELDRYLRLSVKFFQKSVAHNPNADTFIQLAIATSRQFEEDEAIEHLEQAKVLFETAFSLEKSAPFPPAEWVFEYAILLDTLAEAKEDETIFVQALDQFNRVLILDPSIPDIHHRIGLTIAHLAVITNDPNHFMRAFCHFRLAHRSNPDHDFILLDWALTLIHYGDSLEEDSRVEGIMQEAEEKLLRSAKQGNNQAYYQIACFYSLKNQKTLALEWMKKAKTIGALPPVKELLEDTWLENLRETVEFHQFMTLWNEHGFES
jgi:tetratricopeptide (TPR) repeat protein